MVNNLYIPKRVEPVSLRRDMGEVSVDKDRLKEIVSAVSLRKVIHEERIDGWDCQIWFGPSANKSTKSVTVLDYTMVAYREPLVNYETVEGDCLHFKEDDLEALVWTAKTMPELKIKIENTKPTLPVNFWSE